MEQIFVRPMQQQDVPYCAKIEQTALDAWTLEQLQSEFAFDAARLFVAETGGEIAGFAAFQFAADELTLNTLTIDPKFRRRGIAQTLLQQALHEMKQQGAAMCFLEVRVNNEPAWRLYEKIGFEKAGMRRGFYENPHDDAFVMNKIL